MTLREELIQYSNDVISNKITSCKKHKYACMRFLRDLSRENTEQFPYIFIEEKAERFFQWVSFFVHVEGVFAGTPIVPHILHKFVFANIYGWYHKDSKDRRFTKLYLQLARKQAKSIWLSIVSSYEAIAFDESGCNRAQVYCAALKKEQAKIIYDITEIMLNNCKVLQKKYKVKYGKIVHIKSGSFIRPLSKDDKVSGEGFNVQSGSVDEYHLHETSEILEKLDSGTVGRSSPLISIITTAGENLNFPCFRVEYKLASQILDPEILIPLENYMVMICEVDFDGEYEEGDDIDIPSEITKQIINDFKQLEKANPIAFSYPGGTKILNDKLQEAIASPEKMTNFLTKHANVWVHKKPSAFLNMTKWNACKGIIPDLRGQGCIIGVDASAKIDLTSLSFEFKMGEIYYLLSHSFIPEETLDEKERTDKVPYRFWASQGFITIIPGGVIDYRSMMHYGIETTDKFGWRRLEWALDLYYIMQMGNELTDAGETAVEIRQGIPSLNEPTKDFQEKVTSKLIVHDGNPVLKWAISNAVTRKDHNGNIMLDKDKSVQRIDPVAASINSHKRAMALDFSFTQPKILCC